MKTALLCIAGARALLWLCLIPWTTIVGFLVLSVLSNSTSAVTEAAGAALGCFAAIAAYLVVRSLDSVGDRMEAVIRGWQGEGER